MLTGASDPRQRGTLAGATGLYLPAVRSALSSPDDLHPTEPRPRELLDPHPHFPDPRVLQHDRGDLLGDGLDEVDMAPAEDDPYGVKNDVVGDDRAHVVSVGGARLTATSTLNSRRWPDAAPCA